MIDKKKRVNIDLKPTQILVLGFMLLIAIGTLLLNLPIASNDGQSIGLIDALFTATSAVCVTGLVVVNTAAHWTVFGKAVILIMIQIGGLGFMTIATTLFMIVGRKISLKDRLLIQEALNQYTLSGMVRLTRNIIFGTLMIEGIGALLLAIKFVPEYGLKGLFYGLFHSISAFCNAGFDILGNSSLSPYLGDVLVNFTIMLLIILGGIGFTVWIDVIKVSKGRVGKRFSIKKWFNKMTLHTKLVLVMTLSLILGGFVFFFAIEGFNDATLGSLPLGEKLLGALFQSVTTRTAGFNTMALEKMTDASKFVSILFMFIGGSPAGTAGGVKTVTIGILFIEVISVVRAKQDTEAFGRRIPESTIKRALAVIIISLLVVMSVTMILTLTEVGSFMDILFEAVSGFATVGLTLGQTGKLSTVGKMVMSVTMFIGRLGPITMAVAFSLRNSKRHVNIKKPEEKVMVG